MKKGFFALMLTLLIGFCFISCAKKAPVTATPPVVATTNNSQMNVQPAAVPTINPLPYNIWAGEIHHYLSSKKPKSIKNIAFIPSGTVPPQEIKLFVEGYTQAECDAMAKYVGGKYKTKFSGKSVKITIQQKGKDISAFEVK